MIVIDPGHGYLREDHYDPGARAQHGKETFEEARLVYYYALALKHVIHQSGLSVVLTRPTWQSPATLRERCQLYRDPRTTMFISLHFNAHTNSQARGWEILYRYDPPSPQLAFAQTIRQALQPFYAAREIPWRNYKKGQWAVLCNSQKPGCLIEIGFITSPEDFHKLWHVSPTEHRKIRLEWAEHVLRGIRAYLSRL